MQGVHSTRVEQVVCFRMARGCLGQRGRSQHRTLQRRQAGRQQQQQQQQQLTGWLAGSCRRAAGFCIRQQQAHHVVGAHLRQLPPETQARRLPCRSRSPPCAPCCLLAECFNTVACPAGCDHRSRLRHAGLPARQARCALLRDRPAPCQQAQAGAGQEAAASKQGATVRGTHTLAMTLGSQQVLCDQRAQTWVGSGRPAQVHEQTAV